MPDEVIEHLTRDQRPFLHPESLICFFSSVHLTHFLQGSGQRTGMAIAEAWFCVQWPICVLFLRFVFGLLYGWKIQAWPIIRFLTESVTYQLFHLMVFDRIHDPMCLNKMFRTSSWNIGPQHKKYSSIFHCTLKSNFVSSDRRSQSHLKFQSCLITKYAGVCFWMSEEKFFLKPSKTTCGDVGAVWHFFVRFSI